MEGALYFSWGKPIPGHEREALDMFAEALTYWNQKVQAQEVTWFEPFMFQTGDFEEQAGFWVVKAPEEKIVNFWYEPEFLAINSKATIFLQHYRIGTLRVGDRLTEFMDHLAKVYAEVGV